jgi:hypothetical protein
MKIGIMQPYFFPYIGYFSLIKQTDEFILLDKVQFIRHGWIERNRMLKQDKDWIYIKVPLIKNSSFQLISELKIDNTQSWKSKIISQIQPYKKKAPHYYKVLSLINSIFDQEYESIVELNKDILNAVCNYLGISKKIQVFSEMKLEIENPNLPDEWALNICKSIGNITEYWNPIGGESFFDPIKYEKENIKLRFLKVSLDTYPQFGNAFEPGLSILDVMMFNTIEDINTMLDKYTLC